MIKKKFLLLNLIFGLIIFIIGCSTKDAMPVKLTSVDSIKEIINSKGENYDFLNDSVYLDNMDSFIKELKKDKVDQQLNYTLGNLDQNNIPEIAIFIGKDPEDVEDQGILEIYKFNGVKYTLLDKASMNFDIANYQMEIGNISKNKKGIFLNNKIGASSGVTYGFTIEDGKLKSILNDNKMNLVSIFTKNKIKDINDDGILNFSIYTIDPETEDISTEGSEKMTIWYQWNGIDGGTIVEIERKDLSKESSDKETYNKLKHSIKIKLPDFITELSDNKNKLSNYDNTNLLKKYISKLDDKSDDKSLQVEKLFMEHQKGENLDYIFEKYGITSDKLNNIEYLNRAKVLKDEIEIKKHLIENNNLGYKLNSQEGIFYYLIDYKKLSDLFYDNLTREYRDYLEIRSLNSEQPFLNDGILTISNDNLVDRILLAESFKMVYPYSELIPEVNSIYEIYFNAYLYGDSLNPNFDTETNKIDEDALIEFENKVEKYPFTNFANILESFINWLEKNSYTIDDDIREKLNIRLN